MNIAFEYNDSLRVNYVYGKIDKIGDPHLRIEGEFVSFSTQYINK